eukprot:m.13115 g.13115  ORF g.13115 m.13115 type:complete len:626 (+) comp24482_c0_seq2:35-1912(+)
MATPAKPEWQAHTAPDGRKYYYNAETKESRWDKPDELLTGTEQLLKSCPWKEHTSESGKPYYFHAQTEESVWSCPKELQDIKDKIEKEKSVATAEGGSDSTAKVAESAAGSEKEKRQEGSSKPDVDRERAAIMEGREQARIAFKELLKEKGITSTASWEYAIRQISGDTRFHAIKRANERKQLFNEYKAQAAKEERDTQRLKAKQLREDLKKLFLSHEKFHSEIRWRYVCDMFQDAPEFLAVPVSERRDVFEDVIFQLTRKEEAEERKQREENQSVMRAIYKGMKITHQTTWDQCVTMLKENPEFTEDDSLHDMDKEDALVAFQDCVYELEREYESSRSKGRSEGRHQERRNREAFIAFLSELQAASKLDHTSLWMDTYVNISRDERYDVMLDQSGSNPLELFKLYVVDLKDRVHSGKKIVKQILKDADVEKDVYMPLEKLECIVSADERARKVERSVLTLILKGIIGKVAKSDIGVTEAHKGDKVESENKEVEPPQLSPSRENDPAEQQTFGPEETHKRKSKRKRRHTSSESGSDSGDERRRRDGSHSPGRDGGRKKKHKKSKKKKRRNHSRDPSPSPKKHRSSTRDGSDSKAKPSEREPESTSEDEEELERRRAQLLKQLSVD